MPLPNEGSELYRLNAMMDAGVRMATINLTRGYVAFENGISLPIVAMRDRDGDVTLDIAACTELDFGDSEVGFGRVHILAEWAETRQ